MRKSDHSTVLRRGVAGLVILLLLLLLLGAFAPVAMAADWPFCDHWQCEANDVVVTDFYLGDVSGSPLPPCNVPNPVKAYIWIEFTSTAGSNRKAVILLANITIDGDLVKSFWEGGPAAGLCVLDSIAPKATPKADIYNFSWTCGSEVKLEDIIVSWEPPSGGNCPTADRSCGVRNTKCNSSADIIVRPPPIADIEIVKANDATGDATVGQVITYTYNVTTGAGDVNLTNIDVKDDLVDPVTYVSGDTNSDNWLNVTETWNYTGTYTVTQADICADIVNVVTVNATDPCDPTKIITDDATNSVPTDYNADIEIVKTNDATGDATVGQVITYTYNVTTGAGDVNLTNIDVKDDLVDPVTYVSGDTNSDNWLNVTETWNYTGTYTVTQADICADIVNVVTVNATDPCDPTKIITDDATNSVPTDYNADIEIVKTNDATGDATVGQVITYTYNVTTGAGDVNLTNIDVKDDLVDPVTYVSGDTNSDTWLNVTETWNYTGTYTVTQADICADIVNVVIVNATDPCDPTKIITDDATNSVPTDYTADIEIVKTNDATGDATVGQVITYTYNVTTGAGDVNLTNIDVKDDLVDPVTYVSGDTNSDTWLNVTETWNYTGTYTVTQADICADIVNVVIVNATDPCDPTKIITDDATNSVPTDYNADIEIVKTNDATGDATVGQVITYTYNVTTGAGDVNLTNIDVKDDLVDPVTYVSGDTNSDTWLNVTETWNYTGTYTVTQADICADIVNVVIVNATDPCDPTKIITDDATNSVPTDYNADIEIVKTNDATGDATVGQVITYTYNVTTGAGDVNLTNIDVKDDLVDPVTYVSGDTNSDTWLNVTETWNYTGTYTVTQADICADIVNVVIVNATDPCDPTKIITDDATNSVPTDYNADIEIVKTNDATGDATVGQVITYTYNVTTGAGDVNLTNIDVKDDLVDPVTYVSGDTNTDDWLNVTETWNYTGTYTVTQADICADIVNVVTVNATDPCDPTKIITDDATNSVPTDYSADIEIVKTNDATGDAIVGQVITYTYNVTTGAGDVNLTNIDVKDDLVDPVTYVSGDTNTDDWLNVTETWNYTGTYTVTQADICADIVNVVTVNATDPCDPTKIITDDATNSVPTDYSADIEIVKTNDATGDAIVGQVITYTYNVTTGAGDVNLTNIDVKDDLVDPVTYVSGDTNTDDWLNVTETWNYTGTYTVTQADICADIVNVVIVNATDPCDPTKIITDDATNTVHTDYSADIEIVKTNDATGDATVGQVITYTYNVTTGAGDVNLTNIDVKDDLVDPVTYVSGDTNTDDWLNVTETWNYTGTYTVTQADICADIVNVVIVNATDPCDPTKIITDDATNTVHTDYSADIEIVKTNDATGDAIVGQVITYTYNVTTGAGDVNLTNIDVKDDLVDPVTYVSGDTNTDDWLNVTETWNYTGTYTVTQADICADIVNVVIVNATDPCDPTKIITDDATNTVHTDYSADIEIVKTNDATGDAIVGQVITYTYNVTTGAGDVNLTNIDVKDDLVDPVTYVSGDTNSDTWLNVTETWNYTGTYTVTQADICADIVNVVIVNATDPCDPTKIITDDATNTVHTDYSADIEIVKTNDATGDAIVGQVITYTYNVTTGAGDVNLTNIDVKDDLVDPVTYVSGDTNTDDWLNVTETWNYTGTYTVTQADICADIVNVVIVNATDPCDPTKIITDDATNTVHTDYSADIEIVKTNDATGDAIVGQVITYTYNVTTGAGDVNLTNIDVKDDLVDPVIYDSGDTNTDTWLNLTETWNYTGTYTVTQADICADIVNVVTVNATDPCDPTKIITDDATNTVHTDYSADIEIVKTNDATGDATVGQVITYTYNVTTGAGDVNLTNIDVKDDLVDPVTYVSGDTNSDTWLNVTETWNYTGTYTVTQADICADIVNVVIVNATDPCDPTKTITDDATNSVPTDYNADIEIVKTNDATGDATVGQVITYTYNVTTGAGDVNLTNIDVKDDLVDPVTYVSGDTNSDTWLNVTETWNYTGTYTVTQADICADIVNVVIVNATDPCDPTKIITDDATNSVPTDYTADIEIVKTNDATGDATVGQVITYTYNVTTGAGDVNLTNIDVKDDLVDPVIYDSGDTNTDTWLNLTETWNYTGTYTVTQADICADIVNVVTVNATDPCDPTKTITDDATNSVPTGYTADIEIVKTNDATGDATVGQVITYTYNVTTGAGDVNLTNIDVKDDLVDPVIYDSGDTNTDTWLNLTETWNYTGTYTVTQADICADIVNVVTVNATDPCDPTKTITDDATNSVPTGYTADIEIVKTNDATGDATVGQVITYTYNVTTGAGDVNLTNIDVKDDLVDPVIYDSGDTNTDTWLNLTETWNYTGTYTVTQADICADIVNVVTVNATDPCDPTKTITDQDTNSVPTGYTADIEIVKTNDATGDATVGQIITYTYNVTTGTGDVNLTNIDVKDDLVDPVIYDSGDTNTDTWLNLTETWNYTGTYTVTQADICADIVNVVTVNATDPCDPTKTITDQDTNSVPTGYTADIEIVKTNDATGDATVGQIITYTYNVTTGTGDVNLTNIDVKDDLVDPVTYVSGDTNSDTWLNVTETWNYTGTYTVTQADICADIVNVVTVNATDPCVPTNNITDTDTNTVLTDYNADIEVVKTASLNGTCPGSDPLNVSIGDTVTYCFNVTNTGNVNLTSITVIDNIYGPVPLAKNDTLAPGESTEGTETHTVVASDPSSITNTATANGTDPCGGTVNDTDDCTINVSIHPDVELEKTSSPAIVAPGGTVTYTINYTNTGTVPLTNVVITEHYPKGVTFISASPAPDAGTNNVWTIGNLSAGENGTIVIKVKVPEQIDLSFTETGSVIGEGLVMVTKDLSTEQKPYSLRNRVTLSCVTPSGKKTG